MRPFLLTWLLCLSAPALAEEPGQPARAADAPVVGSLPVAEPQPVAPAPALRPGRGVFTGDEHRYQHHWLLTGLGLRILMDLAAMPSGAVAWDARDWSVFGLAVGSTAALAIPFQPHSLDVALQNKITSTLGGPGHFMVWTPYGDMVIWLSIWASVGSTFLYGLVGARPEYVEVSALAVEAFALAQVYTNVIKLVTGRENPKDNIPEGAIVSEGRFYGPAGFVKLFPSGLPSGHVTTMYAIASVFMTYFDTPALWVGLNVLAVMFCATIIADNYHFASETILGAVLGFSIGQWVVRHRSSKFENDADGLPRRLLQTAQRHVSLAPLLTPYGGLGASATVQF